LRERGFRIYVATMDGELTPNDLAAIDKVAIVFGNEHAGVPEELTSLADGRYTIPMEGFAQSLNVSVAAAITLFAATRSRRPDLSPEERLDLRARYMLRSVPRADEVVAAHARRSRP
jgi:tRNA (guanosine-2'-O-)-methyltransferase